MAKPASITTGRIVAQYVVGVVDGADADDEPDFIPAQGSITFETTVGYIPFPVVSGPNPITVLKTRITGILDDEGYLCTPDPADKTKPGARGLRLVSTDNEVASVQGWTWIATPRFVDVNGSRLDNAIPPFPFHLPAQGPEDPPLDLATVVKVPASVGIGTVQAVALAASAQAAAVSASEDAEQAKAAAAEVKRRADEGEFQGADGEPGPAGPTVIPTQEFLQQEADNPTSPLRQSLDATFLQAVTTEHGVTLYLNGAAL